MKLNRTNEITTLTYLMLFGLVLALTGCAAATPLTAPSPSAPPPVTATLLPNALPSATPLPTRSPTGSATSTATITPTSTPWLTSTLLVPTPVTGQSYRLTTWTQDKAEHLIGELDNLPDTLEPYEQGYMGSLYYAAYQYEGLAELESALHFPKAEHAEIWQYDGAYNQFQSSSRDAASLYASLIANTLNRKATTLQNFESWFAKTIPFHLKKYEIRPPRGYQKSIVLYLFLENYEDPFPGGFGIWLLQKEGTFFGYPLANTTEVAYGDGSSSFDVIDLTGDGIAEAIIQNCDSGSFGMHNGEMAIYRLDQVPPQKIELDTPLHDADIATWSVTPGSPIPTITFQMPVSTESDRPCSPITTGWQYRWQEGVLKFIKYLPPEGEAKIEMEHTPFCARVLANTLANTKYLKNETVLAAYKQMLDLPYITKDFPEFEPPFFIEMRRFQFALFLSSRGDEAGAAEQMKLVQASTDPTLTEWRKDAIDFYAVHRDPQALLKYCLASAKCGTILDRKELIDLIPPSRFSEAEMLLQQMGERSSMTGTYDFDQDGQPEIWLFFQGSDSYTCGHDFLILAKDENGIKLRSPFWHICLQEEGEVVKNIEIRQTAPSGGLPGYQVIFNGFESHDNEFLYWPLKQADPTLDSKKAAQMIGAIQNNFMLGIISPGEAQSQLLAMQKMPLDPFARTQDRWWQDIRPQQQYLLGLTYQLDGESVQAAKVYLELWKSFPDSPYSIMAFAKLEPIQ